jgi:hypothetical protein
MVSKNRIGNHAMNLLAGVASYREEDDTVSPNYDPVLQDRKPTTTGHPPDHIHLPQSGRSCV